MILATTTETFGWCCGRKRKCNWDTLIISRKRKSDGFLIGRKQILQELESRAMAARGAAAGGLSGVGGEISIL